MPAAGAGEAAAEDPQRKRAAPADEPSPPAKKPRAPDDTLADAPDEAAAPAAPAAEPQAEPAPADEAPADEAPVDAGAMAPVAVQGMMPPQPPMPVVAPMAQYTMQALAGRTVEFKLLLPNAKCGVVIGKGGAMIKHIREASGAAVDVSEAQASPNATGGPPATERVVAFAGDFGAVYAAFQMVLSHLVASAPGVVDALGMALPAAAGVVEAVVLVPRNKTGGLIGRGGASINRVRQDSGATVKVGAPEDVVAGDPDVRKCIVSGTVEQVMAAFTLIVHKLEETPAGAARAPDAGLAGAQAAAAMYGMAGMASPHMAHPGLAGPPMPQQLPPGTMPVQFQVPNESMGAVIGRAGATINQIRQMSGAKVDIAQSVPGMPMRLVTVTGTPDQIQMAQYLIQVKMGGGSLPSAGAMQQPAAGVPYDPAALQQQQLAQQQQAALMQQQQYAQHAAQAAPGDYAAMQQMQQQMLQQQQQQMQAQQQQMQGNYGYPPQGQF